MTFRPTAYSLALVAAQVSLAVSLSLVLADRMQQRHFGLLMQRSEVISGKQDALIGTMASLSQRMLEADEQSRKAAIAAAKRQEAIDTLIELRDVNASHIAALESKSRTQDALIRKLLRENPLCR